MAGSNTAARKFSSVASTSLANKPPPKPFFTIWLAQSLSVLGQGLASVAIGAWVSLHNGSASQFALLQLIPVLPGLLMLVAPRWSYLVQQAIGPLFAASLLGSLGSLGAIHIDARSFALAVLATSFIMLPERTAPAEDWRRELKTSLLWIRASLGRVTVYLLVTCVPLGFMIALLAPLVLSTSASKGVGPVIFVLGIAMLIGSLFATYTTKPKNALSRMLYYDALIASSMILMGLTSSLVIVTIAGFFFLFGLAGFWAEERHLWQIRVPLEMQGRAFALRRLIAWVPLTVGYLFAGLLYTPGGGIALLILLVGLIKVGIVLLGYRDKQLRALDRSEPTNIKELKRAPIAKKTTISPLSKSSTRF